MSSIYVEPRELDPALQVGDQDYQAGTTHSFGVREVLIGAGAALACSAVILGAPQGAEAKVRPAPSGDTCAEKVRFYERAGALSDKIRVGDCTTRPGLMRGIVAIERAGRYFDFNPVGSVAVSACESSITSTAVGPTRDYGLFQQHNIAGTSEEYWPGRLASTRAYISARTPKGSKMIKLSDNILNPEANAFVSTHMLRRGGGSTHWYPSQYCWSDSGRYVVGDQTRLSDWFAMRARNSNKK